MRIVLRANLLKTPRPQSPVQCRKPSKYKRQLRMLNRKASKYSKIFKRSKTCTDGMFPAPIRPRMLSKRRKAKTSRVPLDIELRLLLQLPPHLLLLPRGRLAIAQLNDWP